MTRTLTLVTLLLLATPAAAAWPWDPVEIRVRVPHEGDMWSFHTDIGEGRTTDRVYLVEGASRAIDEFGIERETVAYRQDRILDGALQHSSRCHRLAGGNEAVRGDTVSGWSGSGSFGEESSTGVLEGSVASENETVVAWFPERCLREEFAGRALREGQTIGIREIMPEETGVNGTSRPAVATSFAGRDALSFVFDLSELTDDAPEGATLEFVFADDLPGPARVIVSGAGDDDVEELAGFTPGDGPEVRMDEGLRMPDRHPGLAWQPYDPRAFDDAPFDLEFPYAEAYAALLADPRAGASEWFAAHEAAVLVSAQHEPLGGSSGTLGISGRAVWTLTFREGATVARWTIASLDRALTPLGPVSVVRPAYLVEKASEYEDVDMLMPKLPAEIMPMEHAVALARAAGMATIAPRISYNLFGPMRDFPVQQTLFWLSLTEIEGDEDQEGRAVTIDPSTGALVKVYEATFDREATGGIIEGRAPPTFESQSEKPVGLAAPTAIVGSAAALTLAGLVGLLLKFLLLPLFTRLRRDRLLDNPVRAKLYDRIRAEPGIHLAELEEFLGIGKGATRHHVDQLARHKLVFVLDVDGYSRCYASGHVPLDAARRAAVLRAGSNLRVYELYAACPGLTLREAAKELDLSAPSIHRAKKRLEKEGLLPAAESGQSVTFR